MAKMTARSLRNRVLTILDRDDTMQSVEVREDDVMAVLTEILPAIEMRQDGRTFLIVFKEIDAVQGS